MYMHFADTAHIILSKRPQRAAEIWPGTKQTGRTGRTGQQKYHQLLSNSWSALNQTEPTHIQKHAFEMFE